MLSQKNDTYIFMCEFLNVWRIIVVASLVGTGTILLQVYLLDISCSWKITFLRLLIWLVLVFAQGLLVIVWTFKSWDTVSN